MNAKSPIEKIYEERKDLIEKREREILLKSKNVYIPPPPPVEKEPKKLPVHMRNKTAASSDTKSPPKSAQPSKETSSKTGNSKSNNNAT
jgi:hypothetical protein